MIVVASSTISNSSLSELHRYAMMLCYVYKLSETLCYQDCHYIHM